MRGYAPKLKPRMCAVVPRKTLAKAAKFAVDRFARELLAVKDSLEAALATETVQRREPSVRYRTDPQATGRRFRKIHTERKSIRLARSSIRIDTRRSASSNRTQEPNTVVSVLQKGYLLADRVLRPALVVVAKGDNLKSSA
jgi:molecular chaperone GrpE